MVRYHWSYVHIHAHTEGHICTIIGFCTNLARSRRRSCIICLCKYFVKSFYFVWCEVVRSCQKCSGEGAVLVVPARWAVCPAKVAVRLFIGRRVTGDVNVMAITECWPIRWIPVYGTPVRAIFSCLRQFNSCPSWFVHQWKQKSFGVELILATG